MSQLPLESEASVQHGTDPDQHRLETGVATFRMLSDPTRLHLLWLLAQAPSDVAALVERTKASRTSVSQHLAKLRFSGLVTTRREGRNVVYTIIDGHLARLVWEGINHAEHQTTGKSAHE